MRVGSSNIQLVALGPNFQLHYWGSLEELILAHLFW